MMDFDRVAKLPETAPLMCKLHTNDGNPIKTKVTEKFPTLSRRHRRELLRRAAKVAATAKPE